MKRRHFLKSVALTSAAGLILPKGPIFGANAPSNKLNIALIGTWGRGGAHFGAISSENVVALCDVNEEHLVDAGLGVRVAQVAGETHPAVMEFVGLTGYAESGTPEGLLARYGLTAQSVAAAARKALVRKRG